MNFSKARAAKKREVAGEDKETQQALKKAKGTKEFKQKKLE